MRCHYCGNHGVRNSAYCDCLYGTTAKIRNKAYKMDPQLEKTINNIINENKEVLNWLSET